MLRYTTEKIGSIKLEQDGKYFNIEIRKGNCLAVLIHVPSNYTLMSFIADEKHLRNLCKAYERKEIDNIFSLMGNIKEIKINLFHKEMRTLLNYLVKYNNVICYWEITEESN